MIIRDKGLRVLESSANINVISFIGCGKNSVHLSMEGLTIKYRTSRNYFLKFSLYISRWNDRTLGFPSSIRVNLQDNIWNARSQTKSIPMRRFHCSEDLEQTTLVIESRSVVAYSWGQGNKLQRDTRERFGVMEIFYIFI